MPLNSHRDGSFITHAFQFESLALIACSWQGLYFELGLMDRTHFALFALSPYQKWVVLIINVESE